MLELKKSKLSTVNSDDIEIPVKNILVESNGKWLTTKVSKNTNDDITEKFDLDTSILSEI